MALSRSEGYPRVFGPYLLLSSLGRGGMGEVFLAKKRAVSDIDRLCIVKTLRGDLAEHREYVRRFVDEARIVVQLNHSNICQVYESGTIGADYTLAMEYIPGVNLKDLALDLQHMQQTLSPGLALYVGEQICEALAYAHRLKSPITGEHLRVVHRDVSPANVMVSFEGEVKLIDFGLAESTLKTEQTETRLVMGKVAYMSPEQARGEEVDGGVDQFAAAVVVYEALTGDRFYGEMNTHQVWQIVGVGGHQPRMWRGLDPDAQAVLGKALSANQLQRYPSCEAFRAALEELRASKYPRAGRAQLREMMQKLYADRMDAESDLIASFADLRAPPPTEAGGDLAESPTAKSQRAEPSMEYEYPRTDPWRNSPSGASKLASPAGPPPGEPLATTTSPVAFAPPKGVSAPNLREPGPRAVDETPLSGAVDAARESGSVALAPPKNTPALLVAAAVAVIVVAALTVILWPRQTVVVEKARDAGTRVATVVDAGVAVVDAGNFVALVHDAGSPAEPTVDAGIVAAHKIAKHDAHVVHHDTPKKDEPVVPPVKTDPPSTSVPVHLEIKPPAAPPPKADLTEAQIVDVIGRCGGRGQTCVNAAPSLLPLLKGTDAKKHRYALELLKNCANGCVAAGVKP